MLGRNVTCMPSTRAIAMQIAMDVRGRTRGFTLIELMMVVAIIGLLAALALPIIGDYAIRARVSEAIVALSSCRTPIVEEYESSLTAASLPAADDWGCEMGVAGSPAGTNIVASIRTSATGVATATLTAAAQLPATSGVIITLQPCGPGGTVGGACATLPAPGSTPVSFICGGVGTTVSLQYLPSSCRGT